MENRSMAAYASRERPLKKWTDIKDSFWRTYDLFCEAKAKDDSDTIHSAAVALNQAALSMVSYRIRWPKVQEDKEHIASTLLICAHDLDESWLEPLSDVLLASADKLRWDDLIYPDVLLSPVHVLNWAPVSNFWRNVQNGEAPEFLGLSLLQARPESNDQFASKLQIAAYVGAIKWLRISDENPGQEPKTTEVLLALSWIVKAWHHDFLLIVSEYRPYEDVERELLEKKSILLLGLTDIIRMFVGLAGPDWRRSLREDMQHLGIPWKFSPQQHRGP